MSVSKENEGQTKTLRQRRTRFLNDNREIRIKHAEKKIRLQIAEKMRVNSQKINTRCDLNGRATAREKKLQQVCI